MSRVVIVGGGGQLAHDLRGQWPSRCPGDEVISLGHQDIEVTAATSAQAALQLHQPDVVVNTSAYHRVDEVEDRPQEAFAVNATGVRHLALACRELDATLIHLSTDYVYTNGDGRPMSEAAGVHPANVYGVSKAAGEMLLRTTWPKPSRRPQVAVLVYLRTP